MDFIRTTYNEDAVLIVKHSRNKDLYTVIPHSYKTYNEFNLHKNYVKEIFGRQKDFLSEFSDPKSHIVFYLTWDVQPHPKYGKNIVIKDWCLYDEKDFEDEDD